MFTAVRKVSFFGAAGWGTLVAAVITAIVLVRMRTLHHPVDLIWFAAASLVELTMVAALTWAASAIRPLALRILAMTIPAALGLIYLAQLYAVWFSGGLLPPLAMANYNAAGFLPLAGFYVIACVFLAALVLGAAWDRPGQWSPRGVPALLAVTGLVASYVGLVHEQPLSRGITVARGEAPISSFIHSAVSISRPSVDVEALTPERRAIRAEFVRGTVYEQGFPEAVTRDMPARPNILVIFTEGMSARWIDAYGSRNPGVTPNLDRLAKDSVLFTNYYNHTAATLRGLRGQLTSGHQQVEGYYSDLGNNSGRVSMAEMFQRMGYRTYFFLSQQERLNTMLAGLGFDHTFGRDYLYDTHVRRPGASSEPPDTLPDDKLFDATLNELKARRADGPFFAALYNIDTHAFLDGRRSYGDGTNPVLNRFHTYDRDFGRFLRRFKSNGLQRNTILVFTTDHSTFPEPAARQADSRMLPVFVDTIPLMIHWTGAEHRIIDVGGKNSLDLAPSLLSLVDVRKAHNLFLGCTFFEECPLDHLANVGDHYVLTGGPNIYPSEELVPDALKRSYRDSRNAVKRFKSLESDSSSRR